VGPLGSMDEIKNAYNISVVKPEKERLLGEPKLRVTLKRILKEIIR
jgi:hypothetical protein